MLAIRSTRRLRNRTTRACRNAKRNGDYRRLKRKYDPAQAQTTFPNVDLDIWSRAPFERLAEALGTKVVALRVEEENGGHDARVDVRADADGLGAATL